MSSRDDVLATVRIGNGHLKVIDHGHLVELAIVPHPSSRFPLALTRHQAGDVIDALLVWLHDGTQATDVCACGARVCNSPNRCEETRL